MVGIDGFLTGWEQKLLVSMLIICGSLVIIYATTLVRERLSGRYGEIGLDLAVSSVVAAIVLGSGLLVIDIWGKTSVVASELGFLRVDERAPAVVVTVIVVIAIYIFSRIARRLLDDLADESQSITDHQREVGVRIGQLCLWGIGLIIVLGVWEVDLTGILVGAGFLGIVIGLAARKTIGSLIAGLVLMFSRPFEVGDWVVLDGQEGIVTDITLMSTRVRAFNGERIVVPNDVVTGEIVINRSREGRLRVEANVGIDYEDDVQTAVSVAEDVAMDVAKSHAAGVEQPSPSVVVTALGDSAVQLTVRVWIETPSAKGKIEVHNDLVEGLKVAFEEHDLTIPYPQRELSAREGTVLDRGIESGQPITD